MRRMLFGGKIMYYGILDQDLNQLRMGFASADPSELASNIAFHILEVTDNPDILTMHSFEIVPISENIYQAMSDDNIETAVVSTEAKYLWPEQYR